MKVCNKKSGLHTLSRNGSLIFCDNCEKILGSSNKDAYKYMNVSIVCTCGNYGSIEVAKPENTSDPSKRVNKMPKEKYGVQICKRCGRPLLGVISDRVRAYSFYVECVCGEKYDMKSTFSKRLGETMQKLGEIKK